MLLGTGLPKSLKVALRTYFHNSRQLQSRSNDHLIIGLLSPMMQSTVALQANKVWLDKVSFLRADWYYPKDKAHPYGEAPRGCEAGMVHSSFIAVRPRHANSRPKLLGPTPAPRKARRSFFLGPSGHTHCSARHTL